MFRKLATNVYSISWPFSYAAPIPEADHQGLTIKTPKSSNQKYPFAYPN